MTELAFRSATALGAAIRTREIGCRELLEHYLARVERHNPALNAIIVTDLGGARQRADAADAALARGESWGALHGLPMTVKELFDVAGMPTTWGLTELSGNIAAANALAVDRLLAAGAVIFGKTNVPVLLADSQSYNPVYGTTNNPWDPSRTPGGSSGGAAAALAAGLTGLETRQRYRRLDPQSGALLRCLGSQADLGHRTAARPGSLWKCRGVGHFGYRAPGAQRRGSRPCARHHCRDPTRSRRRAGVSTSPSRAVMCSPTIASR